MNDSAPLLTVIVPTIERPDTLIATLRTAVDQKSQDFEILVGDNFSQDDTAAVVRSVADPRIRYVNTGRRLSMSDNWNFAIGHAKGQYITIIGDDDGVMPGAIDRLEPFLRSGLEKIYSWPVPFYRWPMDGSPASVTRLSPMLPPRRVNIRKQARFAMRMGTWRHNILPTIYHSAFHRSIPEGMRARTGKVFHTTNPDIFTAFAAPAFSEYALNVGFVVTVAGHSQKSNGGVLSVGRREEALRIIDRHMTEFGPYVLHPSLYPDVPVQVKLIPDAALVAKDLFPDVYGDVPFGYSEMWAWLFRMRWMFRWDMTPLALIRQRCAIRKYHPFSTGIFLSLFLLQTGLNWTRRLWQRKHPTPFDVTTPANIADFVKALAAFQASPL